MSAIGPTCVHCGLELHPNGWSHKNNLSRCQSPDVPYYHLAHAHMPCPSEGPNPCVGSTEDGGCTHLHGVPKSPDYQSGEKP